MRAPKKKVGEKLRPWRFALMRSVPASSLPAHVWALAAGWGLVIGIGGYVYFWRAEEEYGRG